MVLSPGPGTGENPADGCGQRELKTPDAKSLFDAITRLSNSLTEKRTQIDIASIKQTIGETANLKWVPTHEQLADCLTKMDLALSHRFALWLGQPRCSLRECSAANKPLKPTENGTGVNVAVATATYGHSSGSVGPREAPTPLASPSSTPSSTAAAAAAALGDRSIEPSLPQEGARAEKSQSSP